MENATKIAFDIADAVIKQVLMDKKTSDAEKEQINKTPFSELKEQNKTKMILDLHQTVYLKAYEILFKK